MTRTKRQILPRDFEASSLALFAALALGAAVPAARAQVFGPTGTPSKAAPAAKSTTATPPAAAASGVKPAATSKSTTADSKKDKR